MQYFENGIQLADGMDNNVTQNTTINNTNGILLNSSTLSISTRRNNFWNNTIHDRIYTPRTGQDNSFCVNGVENTYLDGATGPTCDGWYPYSGMRVQGTLTLMPGTFTLVSPISITANNITLDCNNTVLQPDVNNTGTGLSTSFYDYSTIKGCTLQNFENGIQIKSSSGNPTTDNNVTQNTTIDNTNGILLATEIGIGTRNNKIWNNTIHDRIYTLTTGINNSFCVSGVGNNYVGEVIGPTCQGWHPYSGMRIDDVITLKPGTFNLTEGLYIRSNAGIDCNNTTLDGEGQGIGINMGPYDSSIIKNCIIQNFDIGIEILGSSNNVALDNNVLGNTLINNNDYAIRIWYYTQSNTIIDNDIFDTDISPSGENTYCVNCLGNRYYQGATGPLCEASCHCFNGVMDSDQLEQGIDCGGNCASCEEEYGGLFGACIPVIKNGPPEEKIDVVFVGIGFQDLNEFSWVANDMIDYNSEKSGLMFYEPFKTYKDRFNFWSVGNVGELFVVNNEAEARKRARACSFKDELIALHVDPTPWPHGYKFSTIGMGLHEAFIPVGNQYLTNEGWPITGFRPLSIVEDTIALSRLQVRNQLVHEFGHSFGGLEDEYDVNTILDFIPQPSLGTPNCDDNLFNPSYRACDKWIDITGEYTCVPGCRTDNWYRPYEHSMMKDNFTLENTFGAVSINELENDILNATPPPLRSNEGLQQSYALDLNYLDENVIFSNAVLLDGPAPDRHQQPTSGFRLEVLSDTNSLLHDFNFHFPLTASYGPSPDWFDENGNQIVIPDEDSEVIFSDINYTLIVPYFTNGYWINLFDLNSNELILVVDISGFAKPGRGGGLVPRRKALP